MSLAFRARATACSNDAAIARSMRFFDTTPGSLRSGLSPGTKAGAEAGFKAGAGDLSPFKSKRGTNPGSVSGPRVSVPSVFLVPTEPPFSFFFAEY
jgi:hypothetical protein